MMVRLFDSHAHLCSNVFDGDRIEVIRRAGEVGVVGILSVSETVEEAGKVLRLSEDFPMLQPAIGLHPEHVACLSDVDVAERTDRLRNLFRRHGERIVAVGEVGRKSIWDQQLFSLCLCFFSPLPFLH